MIQTKYEFDLPRLRQRFAQSLQRAQSLPPPGARPITVAGRVAGWITTDALMPLRDLPGVHVGPEAVHFTDAPGVSLNLVLGEVARALKAAGKIRSWRNELLDVVAEGQVIGRIERAAIRPMGLLSQAVHLNAWHPDGRLWIARRALDKSTDPGMWDTLSGGLVAAGESLQQALLRETLEEAGLDFVQVRAHGQLRLVLRMHRCLPDGYQVENVFLADCPLPDACVPSNLDGEVIEFRCVDLAELWRLIAQDCFTLEAELCILDSLQRRLQDSSAAMSA